MICDMSCNHPIQVTCLDFNVPDMHIQSKKVALIILLKCQ